MPGRDYRDIISGALLVAFGLFVGLYAAKHYEIGILSRMGPGMFPSFLGYLISVLGALIMLPAFFRQGQLPQFRARPFVACLGGLLVFALTIERFGMVPAIALMVTTVIFADDKLNIAGALLLVAGLTALGVAIFSYGLGMPTPLLLWPY
jgi:hypothetical protein